MKRIVLASIVLVGVLGTAPAVQADECVVVNSVPCDVDPPEEECVINSAPCEEPPPEECIINSAPCDLVNSEPVKNGKALGHVRRAHKFASR